MDIKDIGSFFCGLVNHRALKGKPTYINNDHHKAEKIGAVVGCIFFPLALIGMAGRGIRDLSKRVWSINNSRSGSTIENSANSILNVNPTKNDGKLNKVSLAFNSLKNFYEKKLQKPNVEQQQHVEQQQRELEALQQKLGDPHKWDLLIYDPSYGPNSPIPKVHPNSLCRLGESSTSAAYKNLSHRDLIEELQKRDEDFLDALIAACKEILPEEQDN